MSVALLKDMSYPGRMSQARSTGRLNSRVPVGIEWTEAGGKMRAEGSTVDISAKGCMAVVPQGFTVGQKLRVVNLTNQYSCEAILVWRRHTAPTQQLHYSAFPAPPPPILHHPVSTHRTLP